MHTANGQDTPHEDRSGAADRAAAIGRVSALLSTVGLRDVLLNAELSQEIVDGIAGGVTPPLAAEVVQARIALFVEEVLDEPFDQIDPLWLRSFVTAHPNLFLRDVATARQAATLFGDYREGKPPAHSRFADQQLRLPRPPRWFLGLSVPLATTAAVVSVLVGALAADGMTATELLWVSTFSFLFLLTSIGTFSAALGFVVGLRKPAPVSVAVGDLPRSVVLVPICHEDVSSVYAAVQAMRTSMRGLTGEDAFEFFIISDSRDPVIAAEEERIFSRLGDEAGIPVYYRRRARGGRQKVGNVAEFFERWAHRYTYAVMLDADSLLRGETIVTLVRRMHAEPNLALLQAPIHLHRGETIFARAHQFATSLMGPLVTRGLAVWSGPHANFYGHNAVVRVDAFMQCCALPELKGEPPFGGYIMSHDFVEAALLCRAGWEVWIAHDVGPTWEEFPRTLPEYVARDRRWAQGNMQHLRVVVAEGLRAMSRVHMLVGVSSYLAGPLWLVFIVLGALIASGSTGLIPPQVGGALLVVTLLNLLGPRLLGLVEGLRNTEARNGHGGVASLFAGTFTELLVSTLLGPLMMFHHSRIVLSILMGRSSGWKSQRRVGLRVPGCSPGEVQATFVGLAGLAVLLVWFPALLWWMSPVWLSLSLSIPLAVLVSSGPVGHGVRRAGLMSVPSERSVDPLVARADALRRIEATGDADQFADTVLDPVLLSVHLAYLSNRPPSKVAPLPREELDALCTVALKQGPTALRPDQRRQLEGDETSMRRLHQDAWRQWPVEEWRRSGGGTSMPPEPAAGFDPLAPTELTPRQRTHGHVPLSVRRV